MYIERECSNKLKDLAGKFPVVFLTGPRQSGKSTLLRHIFPEYAYFNLEMPDTRAYASDDPRGFLEFAGERVILDEVQRVPSLFSYIQARVDEKDMTGMYIMSGSQNFLMKSSIGQSLAGRTGILSLLPFSHTELKGGVFDPETADSWMFNGSYPRALVHKIDPPDFFTAYIATYVERDIREQIAVQDLVKFRAFMRVCASRTGNPLNLTDIGDDVGADARTIKAWITMLEESYIIFRLAPYNHRYWKRYVKTPKLYFWDTGLLCSLLGFMDKSELAGHEKRGTIFENAVIAELFKRSLHTGFPPSAYFWRDPNRREKEIDLVVESASELILTEIKASQTANSKYADNLHRFAEKSGKISQLKVIYEGQDGLAPAGALFTNWREM
jgi:predicted AAA+ superfamily ATPase